MANCLRSVCSNKSCNLNDKTNCLSLPSKRTDVTIFWTSATIFRTTLFISRSKHMWAFSDLLICYLCLDTFRQRTLLDFFKVVETLWSCLNKNNIDCWLRICAPPPCEVLHQHHITTSCYFCICLWETTIIIHAATRGPCQENSYIDCLIKQPMLWQQFPMWQLFIL